jgi:hypothetical protein
VTNAEEDEKQQARLERRLDKVAPLAWGCLPLLALILLPSSLLTI